MDIGILYNLNWKKIAILALFLILCLALGFGLYYLFFKSETPIVTPPAVVTPGGNLPAVGPGEGGGGQQGELPITGEGEIGADAGEVSEVASGGLTTTFPIVANQVTDPIIQENGNNLNFYNPEDNKFYTVDAATGEMILLTDKEFFQVENVYWSKGGQQAIITYPDGSKIFYDFIKRTQTTLSKSVEAPDFNNNGQVAYKYITNEPDNNWIVVARPDGGTANLIEPMGRESEAVQISWSPTKEVVAMYAKPIGLDKTEVFFIGLQGENFRSLIVDGSNFKGLWSPDGTKILYHAVSGDNNYNPSLWIADAYGDNIGMHKFNLGLSTWVDKCLFITADIVYCAVPKNLSTGAGLYPEISYTSDDLIYKIDLISGLTELIADPFSQERENFSISRLMLTNDGKILVFWDNNTKQVYRLNLR
ncbi:MAG TPA: hypothetical protein PKZ16_01910 [bacterium]|nr:hypothetical protein [bacterium]HPL95789.1 hypothetical protein [bacterium]